LADPFVATVIRGVTRGEIVLRDFDNSPRWWTNFRLRYQEVVRGMQIQTLQVQAQVDKPELASKLIHLIEPWTASVGGDTLDLIARWFIIFQPEKLRARGVDVDGLKH
jgi:hypothetical protein